MKSVGIRGSVVAAVASIFVLGTGITTPAHAQQAALAANPELAAMGTWNPATTYAIDDIVTSRGSTWRSKRNNNIGKVPGQNPPSNAAFGNCSPAASIRPAHGRTPSRTSPTTWSRSTARPSAPSGHSPPPTSRPRTVLGAARHQGADGATGAQGPAGPNTGVGTGTPIRAGDQFNGDADTGIFSPEAGKIALVEDGALFLHNNGTFSAALGPDALASITSGFGNTALGQSALASTTTGGDNTGVGFGALAGNVSGENNTGIGRNALANNTSGGGNTGIGQSALSANFNGANNTAVGRLALTSNTTGGANTAVGLNALQANTTSDNTAVGSNALTATTTGTRNTAMGSFSLSSNTTGQKNIAIGVQALTTSTTADNNIAIGDAALRLATAARQYRGRNQRLGGQHYRRLQHRGRIRAAVNTTGIINTALGRGRSSNTTGNNNTAFGASTLGSNTTGDNNTAVGIAALINNTTGINNTALGATHSFSITTGRRQHRDRD